MIRIRALVTEIVYGTIKNKKTLDMIISNYIKDISLIDKDILNILRYLYIKCIF